MICKKTTKNNEESDFNEVLLTCELHRMGKKIDLARQKSLVLKKNQNFLVVYHHFRKILGFVQFNESGACFGHEVEEYFKVYEFR